jgi:hypothetical protein
MRALSKIRHTNVATFLGAVMRDSVRNQVQPLLPAPAPLRGCGHSDGHGQLSKHAS